MASKTDTYTLRLPVEILNKLRFSAEFNLRSVNKEVEFAVRKHIAVFEKENGIIKIPSKPSE